MNKLLIALVSMIAMSCAGTSVETNRNYRTVTREPTPEDDLMTIIGLEMKEGRMTQEEAFNIMNVTLPTTTPQGIPLRHKFFPLASNFIVMGGSDVNGNCAYSLPYSWDISCDTSELVKCKVAITVQDKNDPLYGTWLFSKECDGEPIGNWTLYGLTINYTNVQHIF